MLCSTIFERVAQKILPYPYIIVLMYCIQVDWHISYARRKLYFTFIIYKIIIQLKVMFVQIPRMAYHIYTCIYIKIALKTGRRHFITAFYCIYTIWGNTNKNKKTQTKKYLLGILQVEYNNKFVNIGYIIINNI